MEHEVPGPFEAAGALKGPTKFAALGEGGRDFTGVVTQKSPYRDGAVPYLVSKFYGGSRIDTIRDGMNREITQRLTDARAPGSSVYNSKTFPACNGYYAWRSIQNGVEQIRVLYDGVDGTIYDATAGQKSTVFTKSAGAGPARFSGVNTSLYFSDGVDQKKWLRPGAWPANTNVLPGTLINQGATPGTVYMALGGMSLPVVATSTNGSILHAKTWVWIDPRYVSNGFANLVGANLTFSGVTVATFLNTGTWTVSNVVSTTLGILEFNAGPGTPQLMTADTGTGTSGTGTTGATVPAFTATRLAVTADSGQQWKSYGSAVQNWGLATPTAAPTVSSTSNARWWQPNTFLATYYTVLDPSGNIQMVSGAGYTGRVYPTWTPTTAFLSLANLVPTTDGNVIWWNLGPPGTWQANTAAAGVPGFVLLDPNGNLQFLIGGGRQSLSGGTEPIWATSGTTTDGALTWECIASGGSGQTLTTAAQSYAYSYHGVDGTVSTASLPVQIPGGILGTSFGAAGVIPNVSIQIGATLASGIVPDTQTDQIWIWRTPEGEATLIFEDAVPVDGLTTAFGYGELGIPDTSTTGSAALNAFIPAPVAEAGDPPQAAMTAPVYYQQREWGIVGNTVVYSGGPDTVTGNGNTAWPPLNEIPFAAQPVRLIPVLVQNGGLIVLTTDGIKIVLGTGTPTNPYYVGDYLELVSVLNYNAVSVFYNQIFLMESNNKVSAIAIEYPFNPQTGYTEVGFPIGDQFVKVTTGGQNAALFNPATAFVSWNANSSADTGMYVSDGAGHWFRMSLINPPESGILWSPLRSIGGGASAVQSVETAPGVHNLLIAPASSGPILMRDTTGAVWTDVVAGTPTAYPAWDAKGVTKLCTTGQFAEIKHISAKSVNTGGPRPTVSVLFNEIAPSAQRPYIALQPKGKSNDPPRNPPSLSVYSDRYRLKDQAMETTGDCVLLKFDYGTEAYGDELLDWEIYGAVHEEDEEQAAKA